MRRLMLLSALALTGLGSFAATASAITPPPPHLAATGDWQGRVLVKGSSLSPCGEVQNAWTARCSFSDTANFAGYWRSIFGLTYYSPAPVTLSGWVNYDGGLEVTSSTAGGSWGVLLGNDTPPSVDWTGEICAHKDTKEPWIRQTFGDGMVVFGRVMLDSAVTVGGHTVHPVRGMQFGDPTLGTHADAYHPSEFNPAFIDKKYFHASLNEMFASPNAGVYLGTNPEGSAPCDWPELS